MYIVRWLMSHPIMSFYALLLVALVLYFSNGDEDTAQISDNARAKQVIVDDSKLNDKIKEPIVTTSNKNSNAEKLADDVSVVEKTENQVTNTTEEQRATSASDKASALTKNSMLKVKDVISITIDKVKDTVSAVGPASSDVITTVEENAEKSIEKVQSVASGNTGKIKDATNTVLASTSNVVIETKRIIDTTVEKVANNSKTLIDGLESERVAVVNSNDSNIKKENHQEIEDLDQSTPEEMLLMAREAYWNNGLDEAAQIYKQLIKLEPNTIEHKGELGNVYWRQGYPKKAAELYSKIALPMVKSGSVERVSNMIGFIGLFYPDRAAEIHKQIQLKK